MSFNECLTNAEAEGVLPKARADEARSRYDALSQQLRLEYGSSAEEEAARRVFAEIQAEAGRRKRLKLLQANVTGFLRKLQDKFVNLDGVPDPAEFMVNLIEDRGGLLGVSTVMGRYKAVLSRAHSMMADAIGAFERGVTGQTRNKALLNDVVRELFGADTGSPAAKAHAQAWRDAAEFLRRRFNAAGGAIAKLEDWGLPQYHDAVAVARAGRDRWKAIIEPLLDAGKIIDNSTGAPMTAERLSLALDEVFETIRTQGWVKVTPSGAAGGRSLANSRLDHRFLKFKDADGWIAYQQQFGHGDAFAAMMAHLDYMARDVAALEILGPNPKATLTFLDQNARRAAALAAKGEGDSAARAKVQTAWNMYGLFDGSLNSPVNARFARGFASLRDVLTSAQLGMAAFSAVSDLRTQRLARKMAGMPEMGVVRDIVRLSLPQNAEDRRLAVRSGLIAEGASQIGMAYARYFGELHARGLTRWMADSTLRWSGLSPFTQLGRWAFGMEFMSNMADKAGRSLDDMRGGDEFDRNFAAMLERYGLDGAWDEIRSTPQYEHKGASFIRPEEIASRADIAPSRAEYLADRLIEMITSETEFAVPTADLRSRQAIINRVPPGSIARVILDSVAMYKSFPSTVLYQNGVRALMVKKVNGRGSMAMYAAEVIVGMSLYGALALQLKNLGNGRDLQDMTTAQFAGAAVVQGGGVGILGDFFFSDQSRAGGNFQQTLAGPPAGFVADTLGLTVGNVQQAVNGDDPRLGRDAVNYARRYTPFGNIWWLKQAYHRTVLDNVQRLVDPDADAYFRRQRRDRQRNFGNDFYWAPGESLPARPPVLESAIGFEPE